MNAIKNVAVKEGFIHPSYTAQVEALKKFSRLYEVGEFENKKRQKIGLPALDTETKKEFVQVIDDYVSGLLKEGEE